MAKIITLGEIMLRLSPEGQDRFIQSDHFRIIPGGGRRLPFRGRLPSWRQCRGRGLHD